MTDIGLFNGGFRVTSSSAGNTATLVNFDQFSVVQPDSQLDIERGDLYYSESADPVNSRQWRWTDVVFSNTTMNESIDANIRWVYYPKYW